jgi:hypothetical protein
MEKKVKKSDLKNLIKECLIEILIEGSPSSVSENYQRADSQKVVAQEKQPQRSLRPALDLIHPNGNAKIPPQIQKSLPPKQFVQEKKTAKPTDFKHIVGTNNVLAEMFADTYSSGLVERIGSPADSMTSNEVVDTGVDPLDLSGSSKWASIAFASSKKA